MSIRSPRRIFRSSSRPVRMPSASVLLIAGAAMAGCVAVAALGTVFAGGMPGVLSPSPPAAARIAAGPAEVAVVDGETLRLNGVVVRLAGIAAPARGDECRPGVDCGGAASRSLANLVRDRAVRCDVRDAGAGRPVGSCVAGSDDLSRMAVAEGWARAENADLRAPEQQARDARRGMWAATP